MTSKTNEAIVALKGYLSEYGYEVSDSDLESVVKHLSLMLDKNKEINLTSIKDWDKALVLHSLDSLLFVLKTTSQERLRDEKIKALDLGTGGGFPGIPAACCSFWQLTLLDSVGKKVKACQEFVNELNLSSRVICNHGRFEEYALNHKGEFDYVFARAVAPLDVLLEYAEPFTRIGSFVILGKGKPDIQEITNANKVAKLCGFENVSRETFDLPQNFGHRELFIYKKISQSRVKLPRKNGEAKNKPLASL